MKNDHLWTSLVVPFLLCPSFFGVASAISMGTVLEDNNYAASGGRVLVASGASRSRAGWTLGAESDSLDLRAVFKVRACVRMPLGLPLVCLSWEPTYCPVPLLRQDIVEVQFGDACFSDLLLLYSRLGGSSDHHAACHHKSTSCTCEEAFCCCWLYLLQVMDRSVAG